jgi:hypothetical protein
VANKKRHKQSSGVTAATRKIGKWTWAAVIAVATAFGTAILGKTTHIFDDTVEPFFASASCAADELFRSNDAPHRLTAVILRFSGDADGSRRREIARTLADEYGVNAIESCISGDLSTAGDRTKNIDDLRKRVARVISSYEADAIIMGSIGKDESIVIVTSRPWLEYLYNDNVSFYTTVKTQDLAAHFKELAFERELVSVAMAAVESTGCIGAVFEMCSTGKWTADRRRLEHVLMKINELKLNYHNHQRFYYTSKYDAGKFADLASAISRIAIGLDREYAVRTLKMGDGEQDVLDIASNSLAHSRNAFSQMPDEWVSFFPTLDFDEGMVELAKASRCEAEAAYGGVAASFLNAGVQRYIGMGDIPSEQELPAAFAFLALARAQLISYAVEPDLMASRAIAANVQATVAQLRRLDAELTDYSRDVLFLGEEDETTRVRVRQRYKEQWDIVMKGAALLLRESKDSRAEVGALMKRSTQNCAEDNA